MTAKEREAFKAMREALRDIRKVLPLTSENWGLTESEAKIESLIRAALALAGKVKP